MLRSCSKLCVQLTRVRRGTQLHYHAVRKQAQWGETVYRPPDITSAVQFKTRAVNNYRKPPFEPDPKRPFLPEVSETCLFPSVPASEGVAALYLYNTVNPRPRDQTACL